MYGRTQTRQSSSDSSVRTHQLAPLDRRNIHQSFYERFLTYPLPLSILIKYFQIKLKSYLNNEIKRWVHQSIVYMYHVLGRFHPLPRIYSILLK